MIDNGDGAMSLVTGHWSLGVDGALGTHAETNDN